MSSHSASAILISRRIYSKPAPSLMWHRSPPTYRCASFSIFCPRLVSPCLCPLHLCWAIHYFFVAPSDRSGAAAARFSRGLFDTRKVGGGICEDQSQESPFNPPLLARDPEQIAAGQSFREQIESDADIAEVTMRRNRARARKPRRMKNLRTRQQRNLPWWQRCVMRC